tara:strand:- start:180 stop:623 length:444 start_codon:yes stop_codon:yes gene_type:complete
MKLKLVHYLGIGFVSILVLVIIFQSVSSSGSETKLGNLEALSVLTQTRIEGRELNQQEIESGEFNNLRLRIDGLSCISCSDTVFYGIINMEGIINAQVSQGDSCIVYDSTLTSRQDILDSELFTTGVYMAMGKDDSQINSEEDAKCF